MGIRFRYLYNYAAFNIRFSSTVTYEKRVVTSIVCPHVKQVAIITSSVLNTLHAYVDYV